MPCDTSYPFECGVLHRLSTLSFFLYLPTGKRNSFTLSLFYIDSILKLSGLEYKMKKLFLSISITIFMLVPFIANAQNYEDVVYLKNGSVIRGVVVEQVPYQTLKIQTKDGNIFAYNFSDIEKITKEMPLTTQFNKPKRYFGLVELGFAPSVNGFEPLRISATIINGYRILPQFAIGVGVGIQGYAIDCKNMTIPFFAHFRSDFLNKKASPFIAFNIGYNFSVLSKHEYFYRGLMMEPSLGVSFNVGSKYRMTVGLGFAVDRVYHNHYIFPYLPDKDWAFALNTKIGFSF